jgi:hypothetical protein
MRHKKSVGAGVDDSMELLGGTETARSIKRKDLSVATVVCRQNETCTTAVSRFCQQILKLSPTATAKILQNCDERVELFQCEPNGGSTVYHHHMNACGYVFSGADYQPPTAIEGNPGGAGIHVPLVYDCVQLRTTISEKDRHLFDSLMGQSICLLDTLTELEGLHHSIDQGTVSRDWRWMARDSARDGGVVGLVPPASLVPGVLTLERQTKNISALLFGVECSAPLKEDMFGNAHMPDAKSKQVSAFGKRKWRDFRSGGQPAPADMGGMLVYVNVARFQQLQDFLGSPAYTLCDPSVPNKDAGDWERRLFSDILSSPIDKMDAIVKGYLKPLEMASGGGPSEDTTPKAGVNL